MPGSRALIRSDHADPLQWCIERPAPATLAVGGGSAVPLTGWCFHREAAIHELRFAASGATAPALAHSLPRPDVHDALAAYANPSRAYASGFYAVLPVRGVEQPRSVEISLHVELTDGRRVERTVDRISVTPSADLGGDKASGNAPVVICMATHEPSYELLARQLESIEQQTHTNWRCLISDDRSSPLSFDRMAALVAGDARFVIDRSPLRRGAYHNFERALSLVGTGAQLVALADQDDRWYPEKLEVLANRLSSGSTLAYSNCRVVRPDGSVLASTFFDRRKNQSRDLRRLLLANTVSGASTAVQADIVAAALPFPPRVAPGVSFHDHWLAAVALTLGTISYVDRPLYDYVQHDANVVGHVSQNIRVGLKRRPGPLMVRGRVTFQNQLLRSVTMAAALDERLRTRTSRHKRRQLRSLIELERSRLSQAQLAARALSTRRATSPTEGIESDLIAALRWRRRMSRAGRRGNKLSDPWFTSAIESAPAVATAVDDESTRALQLTAARLPLYLEASDGLQPTRVNLLIDAHRAKEAAGSNAPEIHLAARLSGAGTRTRIVLVSSAARPAADGDARCRLQQLAPATEIADASAVGQPLQVTPSDVFLATGWAMAHLAHQASRTVGHQWFLYLIEDYEPLWLSTGGTVAAAESSYRLPHLAAFCSEPVREYFRAHRLGVFSSELARADSAPVIATSAIANSPQPPPPAELPGRASTRLLLHVGPQRRGYPEMTDLAIAALQLAAQNGALEGWELNAVGSGDGQSTIDLDAELELVFLGRVDHPSYLRLLSNHDVGVALAATPKPCIVAFEMAAAGLPTVTNVFGAKDERWLSAKSPNLIAVEPTIEGVSAGIATAAARALAERPRGARRAVDWPPTWHEAIDEASVQALQQLVAQLRSA